MARQHKEETQPKPQSETRPAETSAARSTSAGRQFVFEFYELDQRKVIKTVEIDVKAKDEKEAWEKLGEELAKDKRILEYSGRFYIKD